MESEPLTLLCLSHLNWDHVWQRPQQLMSRFSRHCRVIYVDPPMPVPGNGEPFLWEQQPDVGVRVIRPIFGAGLLNEPGNAYEDLWLRLLPAVLAEVGRNTIVWVSSPLADYLVEAALPRIMLAVYDCMDDLASFRTGTEDMREREAKLLKLVDLLFTGGRSLYEARKQRHPRAYCFPSGVEIEHYRQVRDSATPEAAALAHIPHPRLGYFGVLDERIDWPMIGEVAARRPDWQWVFVGPAAKIDLHELPAAPNIHYLGQQPYAGLPQFLKGFDIATMPFALNEATKFISPTKTLEYLAGGKPVLSSSVADVVASYSAIVYLADGPDAWIAAVEHILAASEAERQARLARAQPLLEQSTWDSIVDRMWALIEERLDKTSAIRRLTSDSTHV